MFVIIKDMRSQKALKNVIVSLASYVFLFGLGLITRRLLLDNFNLDLIAYDGIVSDLFAYLTLPNMIVQLLFNYRLYQAFASEDQKRLNKLINMYRKLFLILGFFSIFLCFVCYFLLPFIFSGKVVYWEYFYVIFVLYACDAACSYFFGYYRPILAASQQEYKAISIETLMSFLTTVGKVIILLTTKDYIFYLILNIGCTTLGYIFITIRGRKEFKEIKKEKVTIKDYKDEKMLPEVKNVFATKLGNTITYNSINLLISMRISAKYITLYANYLMIYAAVYNLILKCVSPVTSSIADMVYKEEKEVSYGMFKILDLIFFFLASILLCGFVCVSQNFILMMFGKQYLLPLSFVIINAILYYVTARNEIINGFAASFGSFEIKGKCSFFGSLIGLAISIIFAKVLGVGGVVLGVVIATIIIWVGNTKVTIKDFYDKSILKYYLKEIVLFLLACLECMVVYFLTQNTKAGFKSILLSCILSVCVPLVINFLVFFKTEPFVGLIGFIKDIMSTVLKTTRQEKETE